MEERNMPLIEGWREVPEDKIIYPNGVLAKQVWENKITGDKIIERYNMLGERIFSSRHK